MDPISIEDLALLEVLQRVDQAMPIRAGDTEIRKRLLESGLAEELEGAAGGGDELQLTTGGIELCKSLQHRVAADAQTAKAVEKRKAAEACKDADTPSKDGQAVA